jgi:2-Cys peroxiredoxin 5
LPLVRFGELIDGVLTHVDVDELFLGRRALLIGMPGAFTPICNDTHLPLLVAKADQLKNSGFDMIACITSNDPWILHAWAAQQDPRHKLRFLSDGNLEFARQTGLVCFEPDYYLGERVQRFAMEIRDSVIERLHVESTVLAVTCSGADALLSIQGDIVGKRPARGAETDQAAA